MFGELTAGMAHEINTPLTAARNAFNLMREGLTSASPHYEFAAIASRELTRIADMVEQMYRFHEPLSKDCEALDINALLDNTLILTRSRMRERRIQLRDERAEVVPLVLLPPGAVMLALIQPVKNSIEAMPPDGVLTLRTGSETGGGVFVEIEDNGPGIPPEFLPHLFEPFTTFRHSGTGGGGIGLGMALVRHTLDVLGGTVAVQSGEGAGTCVRIVLPARMADAGQGV
jgi:two-component system NtrC family sensor kinase